MDASLRASRRPTSLVAGLLGFVTGVVTLLAMLRLVTGVFAGTLGVFAWVVILLAMVPWIAYVGWRARHGRLTARAAVMIAVLSGLGLVLVWLGTIGPVAALTASLAASVVIWVHDWPDRPPRGEDHFVRIEELQTEDSE